MEGAAYRSFGQMVGRAGALGSLYHRESTVQHILIDEDGDVTAAMAPHPGQDHIPEDYWIKAVAGQEGRVKSVLMKCLVVAQVSVP
ncbi:hypothetical protein NBRC116598_22650 [Pseudophaeobacter arcticus]|uniref:Uncharacterized protein n=1 Tax=Pseudophaeobacter arcticus TaxID=385492 RepID=A0ABQ0ALS3_9RHOB